MRTLMCMAVLVPALVFGACTTSSSPTTGGADLKSNKATGTVKTTLAAPLDSSYKAALKATDDMKYTTTDKALDALKGVVKARTADGTVVEIILDKKGDHITDLSVDAGPMKTDIARTLVAKIQERAK